MKTRQSIVILVINIFFFTSIFAQEKKNTTFDFGADFVNRYVWRGMEFSDSPAIQPYAELNSGNFKLGVWASYETGGQVVGQEFDLYAAYKIQDFTIGFIDYSFPIDGFSDAYFQMKNHIGEALLTFDGTKKFPLTAMIGVNVYNDDANSVYTELGYPFKLGKISLKPFVGGGNEMYSLNGDFKITNFGLTASKDLKITDSFNLGLSASTIFNPDREDAYLVLMISL